MWHVSKLVLDFLLSCMLMLRSRPTFQGYRGKGSSSTALLRHDRIFFYSVRVVIRISCLMFVWKNTPEVVIVCDVLCYIITQTCFANYLFSVVTSTESTLMVEF